MAVVELTSAQLEMDGVGRRDALRGMPKGTRLVRAPEMSFVVRWDDVRDLLRDKRFAGVGLAIFDVLGIDDGPLRRWYGSLMFTNEGEVHHRLRSLVQLAFVPRSVEALRETTATIATQLLQPLALARQGDLVDFAEELPIRAMGKLIGVADEDIVEFGALVAGARTGVRLHDAAPDRCGDRRRLRAARLHQGDARTAAQRPARRPHHEAPARGARRRAADR